MKLSGTLRRYENLGPLARASAKCLRDIRGPLVDLVIMGRRISFRPSRDGIVTSVGEDFFMGRASGTTVVFAGLTMAQVQKLEREADKAKFEGTPEFEATEGLIVVRQGTKELWRFDFTEQVEPITRAPLTVRDGPMGALHRWPSPKEKRPISFTSGRPDSIEALMAKGS